MPAENRNSDCLSLNWEEFFGSSNSEDLLPCLLNVYDSIAASRKLRNNNSKEQKVENLAISMISDLAVAEDAKENRSQHLDYEFTECPSSVGDSSSINTSSEIPWCAARDVTSSICPNKSDCFSNITRPNSVSSMTSISSRSSDSVCCNASSGSGSSISMDTEELNQRCIDSRSNLQRSEYLDSLVVNDSDQRKNAELKIPELRTSYTTASQYSEDSGIYSSLVRSDSLQERTCLCGEGEDFSYTNRVILEILETELVYVNDLQQIITGYLDEWKNDYSCPLSTEQINDLFGNIEEIFHFNRCFLWELEQCGLNSVKIARCFVENNSNFSIYAAYCTHYPRSINILTELMRQERTAHIFRERQISLHHTLPLGSYLLKPVQRILKYHLLLQNMVKHSSPDTVGYNDITVALSTMTGIAHHINTMKRKHEHAVRVQEVQSLLTGWQGPDLTTFGELYAEGSFRISGAKEFRHIFLFEHMLLVSKKKERGILNYKIHILCSNLMLVECIPKEPLSFQIIPFDNPRLQFSIHARSLEEKRHWTLELKRVILENYSVDIPSHARQLVMELGQTQHSGDVSVQKLSSQKRQHSTPEYLERRKLDREKKSRVKSRLMPLFRKLDTLQNHKMRSKLKKNQFLSENSIFSDSSVISDKSLLHESSLQNFSKTTEDLSQTCDKMARTLEDLSKSSTNSSFSAENRSFSDGANDSMNSEVDERTSYQQKEKLIEEIIGQLLIASQKFQKAIKDHERSVHCKRTPQSQKSGSENEETDDDIDSDQASSNTLDNMLKYTKELDASSSQRSSQLDTSSESLSASLSVLVPMSPNVWLKQQRQHLATPQKKADSLPRTFQINAEDEWRNTRPKTIASDKPSRMNGHNQLYETDEDAMTVDCFLPSKKKEQIFAATSMPSLHTMNLHPDCKFYRTSAVRMTFHKMVHTIGMKLSRGRRERVYKVDHDVDCCEASTYTKCNYDTGNDDRLKQWTRPIYRQGSSDLGARIANAQEVSDYADPKVLFPTITPSKKAASLLGIRAFSSASLAKIDTDPQMMKDETKCYEKALKHPEVNTSSATLLKKQTDQETSSNCSADSFYERQFEEVESEFDSIVRETSILHDDAVDFEDTKAIGESFRRYSRVNVNISVHKLIKIPPPVPIKPSNLRSRRSIEKRIALMTPKPKLLTGSFSAKESAVPTRGWVKQVVNKFQSSNTDLNGCLVDFK